MSAAGGRRAALRRDGARKGEGGREWNARRLEERERVGGRLHGASL